MLTAYELFCRRSVSICDNTWSIKTTQCIHRHRLCTVVDSMPALHGKSVHVHATIAMSAAVNGPCRSTCSTHMRLAEHICALFLELAARVHDLSTSFDIRQRSVINTSCHKHARALAHRCAAYFLKDFSVRFRSSQQGYAKSEVWTKAVHLSRRFLWNCALTAWLEPGQLELQEQTG